MRRVWVIFGLWTLCLWASPAPAGEVSFGLFYTSLSPQGEWISCDGGVYAWRPFGVPTGWRPYYNGQWVWTDDGWYWASDEPWAWATYHYGRWYYDDFYGWLWVPGYDWAPAWVEWQYGGDCVGWAPLSPYAVFNVSFGVRYRSSWITPRFWWSFVDCRHFADPDVHRYVFRSENNARYFGRTRAAGSVRYEGGRIVSRGPERGYIEEHGRVRVDRVEIRDVSSRPGDWLIRDGGRERVEVYRPRIEARAAEPEEVRPERVRPAEHRVFPETRGLDVRAREVDREMSPGVPRQEEPATRSSAPTGKVQTERHYPSPGREGRWDRQYPGRGNPGLQQERRDSRSVQPEGRGRRPDGQRVDRAPSPRREVQRGDRGSVPPSRGGGRRR